ncbi:Peroxisomal leader peptide-processing protease [Portunus trituberculatus]|uniref:Peroxisomal leader peptide-processing protease n=1 Tax=Portunus trituberculatus TaxID=210409 RepID=A0A5B7HAJ6_PORTR|nr:Peroxisomal leader peptide-processing protease [Portunus trituberculatus]
MQGYGVIVKLVTGTNEEISCSGMYLGHGIIFTHGTLLVDLFKDKKAEPLIEHLSTKGYCARMTQEPNLLDSMFKNVQSKIEVILPSKEYVREVAGSDCDTCTSSGTKNDQLCQISKHSKAFVPHNDSSGFLSAAAHIDRIIVQSGVYECLESLMPASQGWKLLEEYQNDITPDLEKLIMSSFVVLTLSGKDWSNEESDSIVIKAAKDIMSSFIPVQKGNFVYVESSPFGSASPSMFLNSLSHGIICNTGPKGQEVLLTDARCITGCEGAPVFVVVDRQKWPCALVISPFCWQKGEWLGLTLLASLGPVLQTLLQSYTSSALLLPRNLSTQKKSDHPTNVTTAAVEPQSRNGFIDKNFMEGPLKDMSKSVVCIKCGKGWGSGVVISASPGIILTCAHVTYKAISKVSRQQFYQKGIAQLLQD